MFMKFTELLSLGLVLGCVLPLAGTAHAAESEQILSLLLMEDFFRNPEIGAASVLWTLPHRSSGNNAIPKRT